MQEYALLRNVNEGVAVLRRVFLGLIQAIFIPRSIAQALTCEGLFKLLPADKLTAERILQIDALISDDATSQNFLIAVDVGLAVQQLARLPGETEANWYARFNETPRDHQTVLRQRSKTRSRLTEPEKSLQTKFDPIGDIGADVGRFNKSLQDRIVFRTVTQVARATSDSLNKYFEKHGLNLRATGQISALGYSKVADSILDRATGRTSQQQNPQLIIQGSWRDLRKFLVVLENENLAAFGLAPFLIADGKTYSSIQYDQHATLLR